MRYYLLFICVFGIIACQNPEKEKTSIIVPPTQAEKEVELSMSTVKKIETPEKNDVFYLEHLEKGVAILGMTVIDVDYKMESFFKIDLEGVLNMKGNIQKNPMEYTLDFYPDESPVKICIDDENFDLIQAIEITNADSLIGTLSVSEKSCLNNGLLVPASLKFNNPHCELNFESKGRLAYAKAEVVFE